MKLILATLYIYLLPMPFISCDSSGNKTSKIKSYTILRINNDDTIRTTYFNKEGKIESEYIKSHINWSSQLLNFWVLPTVRTTNVPVVYSQQNIQPKFNYELPLWFKYDRSTEQPKTTIINKLGKTIPYPSEEHVTITDEYCYNSDCLNMSNSSKDESGRNPSEYNYLHSWTELNNWRLKSDTRDSQNFKRTIGKSEIEFYLCLTYKTKEKQLHIETGKLHLVLEEYNNVPNFEIPYIGIYEPELIYNSQDYYVTIDGRIFRLISIVHNKVFNIKHITEKKSFEYNDNGNIKTVQFSVTDSINGKSTLSAEDIRKYDERGVILFSEGKSYALADGKLNSIQTTTWDYKQGLLVKRNYKFVYTQHNNTQSSEFIYKYNQYQQLTEKRTIRNGQTDNPNGLKIVYEYY